MLSSACPVFWNLTMRLNIHDQFIVGVVRPNGGWSKGRPIAYIEDNDKCVPLFDLLIPNDLDDESLVRYVSDRFRSFQRAGTRIELLHRASRHVQESSGRGSGANTVNLGVPRPFA